MLVEKLGFEQVGHAQKTGAVARDRLYIEDFTIKAGQTKTVNLILDNDTVYCAFQTDLYLPAGLEVVTEDGEYIIDPTSRMTSNHTISTFKQTDGAIRIFVTSQSLRTFTGRRGAIATIKFKAASTFAGRRSVRLQGSVTVEEDGSKHPLDDCLAWVSDGVAIRGDVNGDGVVDVDDLNIVINIMVRKTTMERWPAADLDGNGIVDVDDLNHVINIMVHKE
ncbi:MAG: hypothetical protein IKR25_13340 [Muribaculaceae bacterium]|nr:hypothetical protein [Muribaculaceae bacterium]